MKILGKLLPEEKRNKKAIYKILGTLMVGVMLLIISSTMMSTSKEMIGSPQAPDLSPKVKSDPQALEEIPYELQMEKRLTNILKKMQGVGNVEVMITTTYGKELILAEDITSHTSATLEQDKEGGMREVNNYDDQKKIVMENASGTSGNQPVIIKEKQPEIQGVLVIAEGANHSMVKQSILEAAQTLLGVSPHRVTVHTLEAFN